MVTTGFSGLIPLGRVIYIMTGIICHFIDPSKPKESEHCAEEVTWLIFMLTVLNIGPGEKYGAEPSGM